MREAPPGRAEDVICFSHLRWHFVYQRPQHLLSRCARGRRVFFFEEPVFDSVEDSHLSSIHDPSGITVVVLLVLGPLERRIEQQVGPKRTP